MKNDIQVKGRAKVKKVLLIVSVGILALGIAGCGKIPTTKNGEEVVASMKGKKITADDLYAELKKQKSGHEILLNMIDDFIVNKEIETDEDAKTFADSQIESYKASYESYGMDFKQAMLDAGYKDEKALKEALIIQYKKNVITENYVKDNLTDAEIQKYYENNIYGSIEAKHILISPDVKDGMLDDEIADAEKKAKEEADKLIKRLDKGEDFEKLAKEYSADSGTASKGGKLTVIYGEVVDEFWDASYKLKNGNYTKEPVKSKFGYHIIYRTSMKDKPSLKKAREDVIDKLVMEKMTNDETLHVKAMIELRKKYNLKIVDTDLKKAYNEFNKNALAPQNSD